MNSQKVKRTPSQTIGPYFAYGLTPLQYQYDFKDLVQSQEVGDLVMGEQISIIGRVFDGNGEAISDAMIELWQNDGVHKKFSRFGTGTDTKNRFGFHTIKPKSVDGQAPYINLILFMRGQLIHSYTRIYFSDEEELNSTDVTLSGLTVERRDTLIAVKKEGYYQFDIHMQGAKETVFFDI